MKRVLILLLPTILAFLSACAISEISLLQTAKPLGKGRLEIMPYVANAMNMYPTQDFREIYYAIAASDTIEYWLDFESQETWIKWGKKKDASLVGKALSYGLTEKDDLQLKSFASGSGGMKLGLKHLLSRSDNSYAAIMPFLGYSSSENSSTEYYNGQPSFVVRDKNTLITAELHGIFTLEPHEVITITASPHISLSRLTRRYNGKDYGPYLIPHGGVKLITRLQVYRSFISGEIGFEAAKKWDDILMLVPSISVGAGLQIGK